MGRHEDFGHHATTNIGASAWRSGAALDLSGSTAAGAAELERRTTAMVATVTAMVTPATAIPAIPAGHSAAATTRGFPTPPRRARVAAPHIMAVMGATDLPEHLQ